MVAVFTSVELARDFAETFYAGEDPIRPYPGPMDALPVGTHGRSRGGGRSESSFLTPRLPPLGSGRTPSNHALELLPPLRCGVGLGLEKLFAEACMALGYGPGDPLWSPVGEEEREWVKDGAGPGSKMWWRTPLPARRSGRRAPTPGPE